MAIIIEEQRKTSGALWTLLTWLVVMAMVGAAVYYIFFAAPQLVEVVPPKNLEDTQALSKIDLQAADELKTQLSERLKNQVVVPSGGVFGRSNPFLGF